MHALAALVEAAETILGDGDAGVGGAIVPLRREREVLLHAAALGVARGDLEDGARVAGGGGAAELVRADRDERRRGLAVCGGSRRRAPHRRRRCRPQFEKPAALGPSKAPPKRLSVISGLANAIAAGALSAGATRAGSATFGTVGAAILGAAATLPPAGAGADGATSMRGAGGTALATASGPPLENFVPNRCSAPIASTIAAAARSSGFRRLRIACPIRAKVLAVPTASPPSRRSPPGRLPAPPPGPRAWPRR